MSKIQMVLMENQKLEVIGPETLRMTMVKKTCLTSGSGTLKMSMQVQDILVIPFQEVTESETLRFGTPVLETKVQRVLVEPYREVTESETTLVFGTQVLETKVQHVLVDPYREVTESETLETTTQELKVLAKTC